MAEIIPFRGLRYNPSRVGDLGAVMAPPYDVISAQRQRALHTRHPFNVVRLIRGRPRPDDDERDNVYTRAAGELHRWQAEGVLVRDEEPSIYLYRQHYRLPEEGVERVRDGFIALVRLEEFGRGVLPHESTLSGPKADRLRLMAATRANLSCIFSLYSDPADAIGAALRLPAERRPAVDVTDDDGVRHVLWPVSDAEVISRVVAAMADKRVFIADGHHRYETALAYRDRRRAEGGEHTGREPFDYVMMYFTAMEDTGLSILPTHRLVHSLNGFDPEGFLEALETHFEIMPFESEEAMLFAMQDLGQRDNTFGMYLQGFYKSFVLRLRDDPDTRAALARRGPEVLTGLDVTVLHDLVLEDTLHIDRQAQLEKRNLDYLTDVRTAIESVREQDYHVAFILNPTRVEQVKAVAEAGIRVPQKTTYFYPKLLSGLVINTLEGK